MAVNGQAPGPYVPTNAWHEAENSDGAPGSIRWKMTNEDLRPRRASTLWWPMRDHHATQPCLLPLLCDRCPLTLFPFLAEKSKKARGLPFLWPLRDSLCPLLENSKSEPESGLLTVSLPAVSFSVCLCSVLTANALGF